MGTRPMHIGLDTDGYRLNHRRAVYVSLGELFFWAYNKTNTTQEGDPYHDALSIWADTMDLIASLFDGSETITLPDGTSTSAPVIIWHDEDINAISERYIYDVNTRFANWPLFPQAWMYTDDNDDKWYEVLTRVMTRAKRYAYTQAVGIFRQYRALLIEYNPTADYWKKIKKQGGTSPYASITDSGSGPSISSWTASNGKAAYKTDSSIDSTNPITTTNETTTFDSSSFRNLDKSTQTGKTTNTNEIPNSGYFENVDEEGESGTPIADLIGKELELSRAYNDIYENFLRGLDHEILLAYWRGA